MTFLLTFIDPIFPQGFYCLCLEMNTYLYQFLYKSHSEDINVWLSWYSRINFMCNDVFLSAKWNFIRGHIILNYTRIIHEFRAILMSPYLYRTAEYASTGMHAIRPADISVYINK